MIFVWYSGRNFLVEEQEGVCRSVRNCDGHLGSVRIGRVPFAHPRLPLVDSRSRVVVLVVQRFNLHQQVRFLNFFYCDKATIVPVFWTVCLNLIFFFSLLGPHHAFLKSSFPRTWFYRSPLHLGLRSIEVLPSCVKSHRGGN